jgi:hypothetical protein
VPAVINCRTFLNEDKTTDQNPALIKSRDKGDNSVTPANSAISLILLAINEFGGEGRNRPYFPAVAPQICLVSLGIQAKSVLSDRIVFNPFGVRFGVRSVNLS